MSEYEKNMREPRTHSAERELWGFGDRACYDDVTTLADNYRLIDNNH